MRTLPAHSPALVEKSTCSGRMPIEVALRLAADAPDYPLSNTDHALKLLEVVANSLLRRTLDAKAANAIVNAVNTASRVLELGPIQERMDKIEAAIEALSTMRTPAGHHEDTNFKEN